MWVDGQYVYAAERCLYGLFSRMFVYMRYTWWICMPWHEKNYTRVIHAPLPVPAAAAHEGHRLAQHQDALCQLQGDEPAT